MPLVGGDAGAFVALFRFHGPFLLSEGHLFVLFQPARQCQALAGGDISPHQPLNDQLLQQPQLFPYIPCKNNLALMEL